MTTTTEATPPIEQTAWDKFDEACDKTDAVWGEPLGTAALDVSQAMHLAHDMLRYHEDHHGQSFTAGDIATVAAAIIQRTHHLNQRRTA
jgi:hypothetical protein